QDLRAAGADQPGEPDDLAGADAQRHVLEGAGQRQALHPQDLRPVVVRGPRGTLGEDVLDVPAGHQRHDLVGGGGAGGKPDGDGPAALEDGDPAADLADLLQPVGDVDHRDAGGGQLPDDAEQVADLVVGEGGGRLVHHDQAGV